MTTKEAIKRLEYFKRNDRIKKLFVRINADAVKEMDELNAMCIEALTKQTPTKPNYQGDEACMDAYCPYCGEWLDDGDVLCEKCHQIIDWSDNDA